MYVFKGIGIPADYEIPTVPDSVHIQIMKDNTSLDVIRRIGVVPYFESRAFISPGDKFIFRANVPDANLEEVYAETQVPFLTKAKDLEVQSSVINEPGNYFISVLDLEFGFDDVNEERYYEIEIFMDEIATTKVGDKLNWETLEIPQ